MNTFAAVRYGRVPKRTRDVNQDNMPDLARNLHASGLVPLPGIEEMDSETLRQGVAKELTRMVTAAHRNNNTYTEELRHTLQHQNIILKIDDSDNEGEYFFCSSSCLSSYRRRSR